jgi:hypothetical protein
MAKGGVEHAACISAEPSTFYAIDYLLLAAPFGAMPANCGRVSAGSRKQHPDNIWTCMVRRLKWARGL